MGRASDHAVPSHTARRTAGQWQFLLFGRDITRCTGRKREHLGWRAPTRSSAVPRDTILRNVSLARSDCPIAWNPFVSLAAQRDSPVRRRGTRLASVRRGPNADRPLDRSSYGETAAGETRWRWHQESEAYLPTARRGLSIDERRDVRSATGESRRPVERRDARDRHGWAWN